MSMGKYIWGFAVVLIFNIPLPGISQDVNEYDAHPVKGWTLLSDNLEQAKAAIDHAADYHVNHLQLSHEIIHDLRHVREDKKRKLVLELTAYAHVKKIQDVLVWDHALYNLDYYPARFRKAPGGKIDLDDPEFWKWFKNDYRAMLDLLPGIQGIVLSFIETGARAEEQYSKKLKTSAGKLAAVVNAIAEVVIEERGLQLYARTFSYSAAEYDRITEAISLFKNPGIKLMMKETPHDFFLTHPNDFYAGKINRPTIIEFDAAGEFNGQGVIANTWPEYIMKRWADLGKRPNVTGYTARIDRYGTTSLIGKPGEINLYTLKRLGERPGITADDIYQEFIVAEYGKEAYPYLRKAFSNAYDIITSVLYTLGTNMANHSSLDYGSYPSSYIRHVSGKWIDPPVVFVQHGVNRQFHYWKEIVNHLAPATLKKGNTQFREVPEVVQSGWLQPEEMMNEEYVRYVMREKDYGVALAEKSLQQVELAKYFLTREHFEELYACFERTLLTACLHRAVAGLYFAYRVHTRGVTFRTPYVCDMITRKLEEVALYCEKINAYRGVLPVGEWNWKGDAAKAMEYYREVKAYMDALPLNPLELFALYGEKNIMAESNYGIANGHITARVHYSDVGTVSGLFAPPYASSDFSLECLVFGEKVKTRHYKWYPFEVYREGELNGISVSTNTVLKTGERSLLLKISFRNYTGKKVAVPVQLQIKGGLGFVKSWDFLRPDARAKVNIHVQDGMMTRDNADGKMIIGAGFKEADWFEPASSWSTRVWLDPGASSDHYVVIEMRDKDMTADHVRNTLENAENVIAEARASSRDEVENLLKQLPRFSAGDKRLEEYYYRSLAVLFTNKWNVPEFVLQPYYGSGGVIGGSVTLHLWEFGLPAQIFPLYDPVAAKAHIKQFLGIDITKRSRFEPVSGMGAGSWYQVNQDKIIELIYYYVLHTGDKAFLNEIVEGQTVYDHVISNALFGDDVKKPVQLVDYGDDGENHLELRRGYPYRGIMPDVNGLRYLSYLRAYELSRIAGKPVKDLPSRAESLKQLLKQRLWSEQDNWFYFENKGKKDIRMTNFMYTLIGTGVFDKEIEEKLLSHFNDREFLSDYGIHSISKLDPAYDQVDIDHGGGGSYVAFPPLICQRLYTAGYGSLADDLLQRHLWWGERLPYWGDSKVANFIGYREDTPLQSDFSAISGAQAVIFGLFGVKVLPEGSIAINSVLPSFSSELKLEGLKLRGKVIDIYVDGNGFTVKTDGKTIRSTPGKPIFLQ